MTRSSRFEKLEGERKDDGSEPAASPSLDQRFGADLEAGPRVDVPDPARAEVGAERLGRFDADGADGLGLDRDPLAQLPTLQCPKCQAEGGKFETTCARCGTSLTDDAARAHNLQRLGALQAEQEQALTAERAKRAEEIRELEVGRLKMAGVQRELADELHEKFTGDERHRGPAWPWFVAAGGFFLVARLAPWFGVKTLCVALGTVCLLTRLPRSAWVALAKPTRRHWW